MKIDIKDLSNTVGQMLDEYSEEVTNITKEAIDETMEVALMEVKNTSPMSNESRRHYKQTWRKKTLYEDKESKRVVVYNIQYRLTHLLEYGHALLNGGRTQARAHIIPARERANNTVLERIKGKL